MGKIGVAGWFCRVAERFDRVAGWLAGVAEWFCHAAERSQGVAE